MTLPSELVAHLAHAQAGVRRLAVLDLARLGGDEAGAALAAHLPGETDERAAILIARYLGHARYRPARALLKRLYDDPGTPARIAHAAILAHDAIELAEIGGIAPAGPPV